MKKNRKGFTLVELLVAVLIFGILAAIGTPLYMRTVERTRLVSHFPTIKSLADSVVQFYDERDRFPNNLREIYVRLPEPEWDYTGYTATNQEGSCTVTLEVDPAGPNINMVCRRRIPNDWVDDWMIQYTFVINNAGSLAPDGRFFWILATDDARIAALEGVARSNGWTQAGYHRFAI